MAKKDDAKEVAKEAVELLAQLAAETGRDKIWDRAIDLKARLNGNKGEGR